MNKIFILLLFFLGFLAYYFYTIYFHEPLELPETNQDGKIPKIVWTFWHTDHIPSIVYKCIQTWKKFNPDYQVYIVTKENLNFFLPNNTIFSYPHCGENNIQKLSDFVRLHLIYKYGGFWIDASIILNGSLDYFTAIQQKGDYQYVGYYINNFTKNPTYPVVENWFFAAVKESEIIGLWLECFEKMNDFATVEDYVQFIKNQGVDLQDINDTSYLSMHVACQWMLQKKLTPQQIRSEMYLEKAEDGPFKYLSKNNWKSWDALRSACKNKDLQTLVFKMRGREREILQNYDPYLSSCLLEQT